MDLIIPPRPLVRLAAGLPGFRARDTTDDHDHPALMI
jgi:hypothetical protein